MEIRMAPFAAVFLFACAAPQAQSTPEASSIIAPAEGLDQILETAAAEGFGGQVAISRHGALVYDRAAGFADNEGRVPANAETLYQVASMTKFFTAVMILKAVDEGKLSLDDASSDLFAGTLLAARDFTLRDLLDHRSGLRSTYAAESVNEPATALAAIAKANADNQKDGDFHYSNDAYDALAVLLERIYAKPFEAIFREKIAAPAGLAHFSFWGEAALDDPHTLGQPVTPIAAELKRRNYGMIGSAGLLISAKELVRFRAALDDGRILSPSMLEELNEPRMPISIGDVLFGAFRVETPLGPAISARGAEDWGDNAYLNAYPSCGAVVAVLTSRGPTENSGKPLFRDSLITAIEAELRPYCESGK